MHARPRAADDFAAISSRLLQLRGSTFKAEPLANDAARIIFKPERSRIEATRVRREAADSRLLAVRDQLLIIANRYDRIAEMMERVESP